MDAITFCQKAYGKLFDRKLFAFHRELYAPEGVVRDPLRERQTRLGMRWGTRFFSRVYPGIPGRIHIHDTMLQSDSAEELAHYAAVGASGMAVIEGALKKGGRDWGSVRSCLDMACGYGRVQRHLAGRIGGRRITACEVIPEAVRFCAEEFGSKPLDSTFDLMALQFPERYDLIWVGSLLTHLAPESGMAFAAKLARQLAAGGILVFSTQGPTCLEHIPMYGFMFEKKTEEFRRQLEGRGGAYFPYYEATPDYGIALLTPDYVRGKLAQEAKLLEYRERGWDGHQDTYAWQAP